MPLKLAVYNSQIHCHRLSLWRRYAPEVKQPRDLSDAGQKSRELTTLPESPNSNIIPPVMHTPNTPPEPGQCRPLCNVTITSCCAAPPEECTGPHRFQCDSGECIPIDFRCDDYDDCDDASDEKHCCKLTVIVRVVVMVVVVQPNTLESNVLRNFFSSISPGFCWFISRRRINRTLQSNILRMYVWWSLCTL